MYHGGAPLPPYPGVAGVALAPLAAQTIPREICKDFNNKGGYCPRGLACPFLHIYESELGPGMGRRRTCKEFLATGTCPRGSSCPWAHKERKKTDEICKDFNNFNGYCPRGDACPFQHVREKEPYDFKRAASTKPCRHWMWDGFCPRGETCAFLHENPAAATISSYAASQPSPTLPSQLSHKDTPTLRGPGEVSIEPPPSSVKEVRREREKVRLSKELVDLLRRNKELMQLNTQKREENTKLKKEIVELRKGNLVLRKENLQLRKVKAPAVVKKPRAPAVVMRDSEDEDEGSEDDYEDGGKRGSRVQKKRKAIPTSRTTTTTTIKKRKISVGKKGRLKQEREGDDGNSDDFED